MYLKTTVTNNYVVIRYDVMIQSADSIERRLYPNWQERSYLKNNPKTLIQNVNALKTPDLRLSRIHFKNAKSV